MNKKDTQPHEAELNAFRREIDAIDDVIIGLLKQRIAIVEQVGEMKRRTAPGLCPIRPAREAEMVRRVMQEFESSHFSPAAAAALWRIIIGASTAVESPLSLSVYAPDRDDDYVWMAREYFGSFVPITRQLHVKRVIGDVMDGKAAVGIVPMLRGADSAFWWTNLIQPSNDLPKVFARIPFVHYGTPGRDTPTALAIARLEPEASGDDRSLWVLEADHNVSQHRLQGVFAAVKAEAAWINVATLHPAARHHLVELNGFVTPEHPAIAAVAKALGASLLNLSFIGAYAAPITLTNGNSSHENKPLHAAAAP